MRNLKSTVLLSVVMIALSSCGKSEKDNCVSADGNKFMEYYEVSDFSKLVVYGDGEYFVEKKSNYSMMVDAQQDVQNALNVEVHEGQLQVAKDNCFRDIERYRAYIYCPVLNEIRAYGNNEIRGLNTTFDADVFYTELAGSGRIFLNFSVNQLYTEASGSGFLKYTGSAESQNIDISGSADVLAYTLNSKNCTIKITGSGNCEVMVTDNLNVEITGSGNVYYKGNPTITSTISGSGRLIDSN